ncbi:4-hydroxy-3-methylbut-2-enyl diphosphate reductase [Pseudonocardia dioxanivorans]|uniref:4-hydroxy-3-methylbut-2-enyl diphosphate reductase n=2 Tax=Pseudonocardia TaxID=1847 RepID=F4D0Z9_PSEUX|nr:4-hydroxy-3-methylbut-2-enyl diphosphate reductase [Pseudonocardia dioxanivorans]AEA25851.1 4-hydroxy-3-methylbut-2-enyl diphosphate reductase [Pseudonocardia dioxanivorans CB1190]
MTAPLPHTLGPPVVCAPLAVERRALDGDALAGVRLVRTGMGRRAAGTARALAVDGPRPVLVAGVAGALAPHLEPGDVVVADEVRDGTGARGPVAVPTARPLAAALRALGLRVHVGPVVSTPQVVDGDQRIALATTGALVVDMESADLAAAAAGGPFAVVRVVVDTPGAPLLRPGTPVRGLTALRTLRRAAPALRTWLDATGPRTVRLAEPRSFCAGVERAIEIVDRALDRYGAPVYVRRQIVHNAHVVRRLTDRGAVFVQEVDEVPPGAHVVLAAHGVSPAVRADADARGLSVVDATCPLVAKVHTEVRRHARRGESVLLIGHSDHEEVEGTVGEAPARVTVVEDEESARTVEVPDPTRVAYAMQTTLAVDEAERIAAILRERFPSIAAPRQDDICYATTNRQRAIRAVSADVDLVIVVGSPNSSNSRRLAEVAARQGVPAHLVDDVSELDLSWLAGVGRVGLSAGASAPDDLVDEVVSCLSGLGPVTVTATSTGSEHVRFTLPKEVSH